MSRSVTRGDTNPLNMVNEINVNDNMTIREKVEKVVDYVTNFVKSHDIQYNEEYSTNNMLYIVHFKTGVCSNYSHLEHALLKLMGIDSYYIGGLHPVEMSETSGDYYLNDGKYELEWYSFADGNQRGKPYTGSRAELKVNEYCKEDFFVLCNGPIF